MSQLMDIFIENSTEDDATVKVYPSGPPREDPGKPPREVKVKANTTRKLTAVPASCVVHFVVPVEVSKYEMKPPTASLAAPPPKRLTLTKIANDGYKVVTDVGRSAPYQIPNTGEATKVPVPDANWEIKSVARRRSDILARKHGGQPLSPNEQERLESLTARLKELLPPVSPGDLEALVEMAEEAERIRKRAQERRQRLASD